MQEIEPPTPTSNILLNNQNDDYNSDDLLNVDLYSTNGRPWYFSNGHRYPKPARINHKTNKRIARLIPSEDTRSDRITNQLMFVPPNYEKLQRDGKFKTILLYNGLGPWNVKAGRELFTSQKCPVSTCLITANREKAATADLVLFKDHYIPPGVHRSRHQIYMLYFLECPFHTQHIKCPDAFNWTSTYRFVSLILRISYARMEVNFFLFFFVFFDYSFVTILEKIVTL